MPARDDTGSEPGFGSVLNNLMAVTVMIMSVITVITVIATCLEVIPVELAIGQAAATSAVATAWRISRQT